MSEQAAVSEAKAERNTGGHATIAGYKRRDVIKGRLKLNKETECLETHQKAQRWNHT